VYVGRHRSDHTLDVTRDVVARDDDGDVHVGYGRCRA
jgi:hypothetical protein